MMFSGRKLTGLGSITNLLDFECGFGDSMTIYGITDGMSNEHCVSSDRKIEVAGLI